MPANMIAQMNQKQSTGGCGAVDGGPSSRGKQGYQVSPDQNSQIPVFLSQKSKDDSCTPSSSLSRGEYSSNTECRTNSLKAGSVSVNPQNPNTPNITNLSPYASGLLNKQEIQQQFSRAVGNLSSAANTENSLLPKSLNPNALSTAEFIPLSGGQNQVNSQTCSKFCANLDGATQSSQFAYNQAQKDSQTQQMATISQNETNSQIISKLPNVSINKPISSSIAGASQTQTETQSISISQKSEFQPGFISSPLNSSSLPPMNPVLANANSNLINSANQLPLVPLSQQSQAILAQTQGLPPALQQQILMNYQQQLLLQLQRQQQMAQLAASANPQALQQTLSQAQQAHSQNPASAGAAVTGVEAQRVSQNHFQRQSSTGAGQTGQTWAQAQRQGPKWPAGVEGSLEQGKSGWMSDDEDKTLTRHAFGSAHNTHNKRRDHSVHPPAPGQNHNTQFPQAFMTNAGNMDSRDSRQMTGKTVPAPQGAAGVVQRNDRVDALAGGGGESDGEFVLSGKKQSSLPHRIHPAQMFQQMQQVQSTQRVQPDQPTQTQEFQQFPFSAVGQVPLMPLNPQFLQQMGAKQLPSQGSLPLNGPLMNPTSLKYQSGQVNPASNMPQAGQTIPQLQMQTQFNSLLQKQVPGANSQSGQNAQKPPFYPNAPNNPYTNPGITGIPSNGNGQMNPSSLVYAQAYLQPQTSGNGAMSTPAASAAGTLNPMFSAGPGALQQNSVPNKQNTTPNTKSIGGNGSTSNPIATASQQLQQVLVHEQAQNFAINANQTPNSTNIQNSNTLSSGNSNSMGLQSGIGRKVSFADQNA